MIELPVVAEIDNKNGIIDGRDYALKCIMMAYRLLGAYADKDPNKYEALKRFTEHEAQYRLHVNEEDVPDQSMVPHLFRKMEEEPSRSEQERWEQHLEDTKKRTEAILFQAASLAGK